ncbi:outer membrane protein assembly factor BamA [Mesobaculum littorinae]|uniref:Outer membrane protein assembly factor BamA n=1 Tax=Mesobaculum littorinae TaxID=2486419 RepID=A0A438ALS4_9RHOB|nr:outer membrane protein assembly factor BamA [Mesobaculum littorinae]RVV99537.1 outer membrane protein assembly factor BamA [Mesobaculum littorinae]
MVKVSRDARRGVKYAVSARVTAFAVAGAVAAGSVLSTVPVFAQSFQFSNVVIEGNNRVDSGTILNYAEIPQGASISGGGLNDAYQRLVNSGLFETVSIEPQGGTLVISVEEWPVVNRISIEGNDRLDDEQLLPLIQSQSRRIYDPAQAEQDAATLTQAYEESGRLGARITPRIIDRGNDLVDLVFEVSEGGVVEIERVSFVGNSSFSDGRLRRVLDTKQAGPLRQLIQRDTFIGDRLEFDKQLLTDFYRSRGYVDFEILSVNSEFSRERNAFFVTFNVREGQSYEFGEVSATSSLPGIDAQDYLNVTRTRRGQTYSPSSVENDVARMERLAIRRGMTFVRATPQVTRNDRAQTLDINYELERGPRVFVERIDIEGNQTTLDRVIRREFDTVEGDPFNPRQIRASAERIRALGYFKNADVETREGSSPEQVIVDVDVEEQPTGNLSFGGSYSVDDGPGVAISFAERNFLGRGQSLRFQVATGTDSSNSVISFVEPYFLGRDLEAGINVFYRVAEEDDDDYNTEVLGFSPSLEFPIGENTRLGLNYRLSRDRLYNVSEDSSPILQAEEGTLISSSVGYSLSYDTRRTGLNPNAGVLLRFNQDFAGLGGDNKYVKTTATAIAQRLVMNEEVTLRATLEGGALHMIDGDSRVTDRFFLSGNDLRGFEGRGTGPRDLGTENQDALGGNFYTAARFEAEFPLGTPEEYGFSGGVFLDAGSVWGLDNTDGAEGEVDDGFALRSSIGVSLFWDTAIGPLQLNLAKPIKKEEYDEEQVFNLTIATQF